MKYLTPLVIGLAPLLFVGCNSTSPLTIEEHGAAIAQSISTDIGELKYISPGDFAPFNEVVEGFNPNTKGVVALTEASLYWRDGKGDFSGTSDFQEISLESITGAALDAGVLQLRIGEQLHVLRLTQWNPYQSSPQQTQQILQFLRDRSIPEFEVEYSVGVSPIDRPSPFEKPTHNRIASKDNPFGRDLTNRGPSLIQRNSVTDGSGNTTIKTVYQPTDG